MVFQNAEDWATKRNEVEAKIINSLPWSQIHHKNYFD